MLEVLKQLVDIGNNGKEEMNNKPLKIEVKGDFYEGQSYYYQEYKVISEIEMKSYNLYNLNNFPEGSYVANTKNIYQAEFDSSENFRILIPKDKFNENINGKINIVGKCKNYPIFYGEGPVGKQDYILTYDSYGDIETECDINFKVNNGRLKVIKLDKDNRNGIKNVQFKLISEDGKYTYEGITDENGIINFEELFPSKYILKEIEVGDEYIISDEEFEIIIQYDSEVEIEIFNELKKGNIKIIKVDKENKDLRLSGVIFELYDENMNLLEELTTNEKGEAISKIYPSENRKYFLKEIRTIDEYMLDEKIIEIKLEEGKTIELEIENDKIEIPEIPNEPIINTPEEPIIEEIPEEPIIENIPKEEIEEIIDEPIIEEKIDVPIIENVPEIIEEEIPKLPKTGY